MRMDWRFDSGWSTRAVNSQQVLGRGDGRHRTNFGGEDPPFEPSVKSQTFPSTAAARPVGPATACAWASVGKLSMRQNSGPDGNCEIFFSATDLTSNFCSDATDDDVAAAQAKNATANTKRRCVMGNSSEGRTRPDKSSPLK